MPVAAAFPWQGNDGAFNPSGFLVAVGARDLAISGRRQRRKIATQEFGAHDLAAARQQAVHAHRHRPCGSSPAGADTIKSGADAGMLASASAVAVPSGAGCRVPVSRSSGVSLNDGRTEKKRARAELENTR
jgi:hypothetical protein